MRIKRFWSLCAIAALATGGVFADRADAALLVNDNFDGYANTAAFTAAWPVVGALPSGTISTVQSVSPTNSVKIEAPVGTNVQQRNGRSFTETGDPSTSNHIAFSFDFYDWNSARAPFRQYANIQDGAASAAGQLVAMGLNNNLTSAADGGNYYMARILGFDGGTGVSAFFKLNDLGAPLRSTGWHNLMVVISNTDFKFFVDGTLSQTVANAAPLRSYETVRIGGGVSAAGDDAYYDNVRIATFIPVPEPATLALAGMGLIGICGVARRKNA